MFDDEDEIVVESFDQLCEQQTQAASQADDDIGIEGIHI